MSDHDHPIQPSRPIERADHPLGKRAAIRVERTFDAAPERVFAAWRDAAGMRAWMCPMSAQRATVDLDFRVGGEFRIVMHTDDQSFAHRGVYLEIDAPNRLVFSWVSDFIAPDEAVTVVTVTLEELDDNTTLLRLAHDELPDTSTYDNHEQGWPSILDKLAGLLARRALEATR